MDLLKSDIKPMYLRYLAAASGSAVVASVFGVVDAMMVGQYHGPAGNAALAVFNPIWSIVFCLGLLAGIGGSVLFASSRGRGDEQSAQEYFTLSVLWGVLLSAVAVAGIGLYQEQLFRFFGADDELLALAKRYLKPILFAIPCCVFSNILSAALRNDGNPGLATKAVIAGGIFNMIGDYYLVFVRDMGISGAGLATALAQFVTIGIMLLHFVGRKNTLRIVRPTCCLRKMGAIAVNGFSTAISDLALGIIGILFNRQIMRYLGTDALAVYGIITQVTAFVQCMAYGIGQAAQPIISQNYGAGNFGRIRQCLKYALYTSAAFGVFWTLAMLLMPTPLVYLFMTPTPQVLSIAPGILCAYGSSFVLLPFNIFATYYFQAMMKPQLSLAASVARSIVVSGAMILLLPLIAGADSLWYAMLITEILVAAFGGYYTVKITKSI
jgi:putative MATE family efflux protein